ncbi:hypothetical protein BAUCODRAFT_52429, partial [Baudoinia panamericana UAMH 10762]
MVFSTTNLFKGIPCPEGERCKLTNCIFAHNLRPKASAELTRTTSEATQQQYELEAPADPAPKRRRLTYEKPEDKPPSQADLIRTQLLQERKALNGSDTTFTNVKPVTPTSLKRSVSPPAKASSKATSPVANATNISSDKPKTTHGYVREEKVALNPRLIPNDPAGHAKRMLYLKHLHGEMVRLNEELRDRKQVQYKNGLMLSETELIRLALDEEEKLAREQGNVYANVIKLRIGAYKKMRVDAWIMHVMSTSLFKQKQQTLAKPKVGLDAPIVIETGLTPDEEASILPQLTIKNQKALDKFGYIPTPPTSDQAAEAAAAVEASKNYEECDRCMARFQVFPQRNEEGLLTSNGKCRHHPMRKVYPQRSKADTGPKEAFYPCCNEPVGRAGCTVEEHHVFKASSPARLAAVMPFIFTPENESPAKDAHGNVAKAVALDCEMGYTTLGFELIRLTAVSFPEGEKLIDVLVRPLGIVLDLNSRFSGVSLESMANAVPYTHHHDAIPAPQLKNTLDDSPPPPALPIVNSPSAARDLLCSFITPTTPLIGHAIDNDLNVVRLCHPTIIDTIMLYPHPRGLPMRYALRMLSSKYLNRGIQLGGDKGHDSLEDARATGDLVRVKVGEKWKMLKMAGWKFVEGELVPPL